FRARDFSLGILDVFLEGRLIPDDARILVGIGILVIRDATGFAAVQAILCRTDLVLRARTDAVADHTLLERDFALGHILRHSCLRRRGNQRDGRDQGLCHHASLPLWYPPGARRRRPRSTRPQIWPAAVQAAPAQRVNRQLAAPPRSC